LLPATGLFFRKVIAVNLHEQSTHRSIPAALDKKMAIPNERMRLSNFIAVVYGVPWIHRMPYALVTKTFFSNDGSG
jgi:hypothetical protein